MYQNKVLAYLKSREGQEVSYDEILADAGVNPSTLPSMLSQLSLRDGNGVTRIPKAGRKRSTYRYDSPERVTADLHVIGKTRDGLTLVQDGDNRLFELRELRAA